MAEWFDWAQDAAKSAITAAADISREKQRNAYEIEKLKLQALGTDGYYTEGQANRNGAVGGISPTVLLLGAAVVAILMLKG